MTITRDKAIDLWTIISQIFKNPNISDEKFWEYYARVEQLTAPYYQELDWIENNIKPEKPIYDPFVELQPNKSDIQSIVRRLKTDASAALSDLQKLKGNPVAGWLVEEITARHKALCRTIESYEFRLRTYNKVTRRFDTPKAQPGRITDSEVHQAKQRPIQDYYRDRLRKSGRRLYGRCPFHTERTGSFVVYIDQNSFHCYGCGVNGDVIDFVRQQQNIDFISAVKFILNLT